LRSNLRTALSRRSKGVLLKIVSRKDEIRNTRFSLGRFAKKSPPVGVFSPTSSR